MNKNFTFIVRLDGGMGNQMFQYAHARYLIQNYGGKMVFDNSSFRINGRQNALIHLNLYTDNIVSVEDSSLLVKYTTIKAKILRRLKLIKPENYTKLVKLGMYAQVKTNYYDSLVPPSKPTNYVFGNWMSYKFFGNIGDILRREFTFKTPPSEQNVKMMNYIKSCNAVCLHIRRGDYVSDRWASKLLVCGYDYYKKAVNYIIDNVFEPVFFVFSNNHDDLEWIKANYHFDANLVYVDLMNPDFEELRLMSCCQHFILSNSTFSFWAQYLCNNPNKIVVSPKSWNSGVWNVDDIIMENWHLIEN